MAEVALQGGGEVEIKLCGEWIGLVAAHRVIGEITRSRAAARLISEPIQLCSDQAGAVEIDIDAKSGGIDRRGAPRLDSALDAGKPQPIIEFAIARRCICSGSAARFLAQVEPGMPHGFFVCLPRDPQR